MNLLSRRAGEQLEKLLYLAGGWEFVRHTMQLYAIVCYILL